MGDLTSILAEAKELEVNGKYAEAHKVYSTGIEQAQPAQDALLATLLNGRGITSRMLQNYDAALEDFEAALACNCDGETALAHINSADIYRVGKADFAKAHKSLDQAVDHIEEIGIDGSLIDVKCIDQRGLVFLAEEKYTDAISCYEGAQKMCETLLRADSEAIDIRNRYGQVMTHLGVAYIKLNDPTKVEDAYQAQLEALEIFKDLGDQQGMFNTLGCLAGITAIRDDPAGALEMYKQTESIVTETGYDRALTGLKLHIAECYLKQGDTENALPCLRQFAHGVISNHLTKHDLLLQKPQFEAIDGIYEQQGLDVPMWKEAKAAFDKV